MSQQRKSLSVHEIKQALLDDRFRKQLPVSLNDDIVKFLQNPGCSCNGSIYRRVAQEAREQLLAYYPGREPLQEDKVVPPPNRWRVINCTIQELERQLQALGPGRRQVSVARYQDQVTVVINDLD